MVLLSGISSKNGRLLREKVSLVRTKVRFSGGIADNGMSKNKAYRCGFFSLTVNASSVLYVQCGKWNHSMCVGVKR